MSKKEKQVLFLILAALFFGWILVFRLSAQNGPSGQSWRIKPQLIVGTATVDICTLPGGPPCNVDVGLCYADASTGATPAALSISDHQATPIFFFNAVAMAANTTYAQILDSKGSINCRWFPNGLSVKSSVTNAISVELSGKY